MKGGGIAPSTKKQRSPSKLGHSSGSKQQSAQQISEPMQPPAPNQGIYEFEKANEVPLRQSQESQKFAPPAEQQQQQPPQNQLDGPDVSCGSHLNSFEDLNGYPVFPAGTKSLLSKYLTRDIWNKYKLSNDEFGFSFREAIFSGCKNVDSGIGVYAGSQNSYETFSDLFDKVIEDYHGHGLHDTHKAEDPNGKIEGDDFAPDEAAMILSTRIRVGRNLADFPLGPGLTNE